MENYPLPFASGKGQNATTCFNITVIDDGITHNDKYFTVYITSNDSAIKLIIPTNSTVEISDSDSEWVLHFIERIHYILLSSEITVGFVSEVITANESTGYVTVCVKILMGILGRNAAVYLSTVDITALNSSKFNVMLHNILTV